MSLYRTQARLLRDAVEDLHISHHLVRRPQAAINIADLSNSLQPHLMILSAFPRSLSSPPLAKFKAFLNHGWTSVVIVNGSKGPLSRIQEFYALHEYGHVSDGGYVAESMASMPLLQASMHYIPCLLLSDYVIQWMIIGVLIPVEWFVKVGPFLSEIAADCFAVERCFRKRGRESTLQMLALLRTVFQRSISANPPDAAVPRTRLYWIEQFMQALTSGDVPERLVEKVISRITLFVFVCRALAVVTAFFSLRSVSNTMIHWSVAALLAVLLIALINFVLYQSKTRQVIVAVAQRTISEEEFLLIK